MDDLGEVLEACALGGQEVAEAFERAGGGVVRGGEAFVQAEGAGGGVGEDEVGEGAADVEAEAEGGGHEGFLWRGLFPS